MTAISSRAPSHSLKGIIGFVLLLGLAWLVARVPSNTAQAAPAAPTCGTATGATYSINVCITDPASNSTNLSGVVPVTSTVSLTSGSTPGIQKLVFTLDGTTYVLTDYSSPWRFDLPTYKFSNGPHSLSATLYTNSDGQVYTNLVTINLSFNNSTFPPPNIFAPAAGTQPAAGQPFVIAAVGDGAGGEQPAADVTNLIASWNPNMFLYLGDVYEEGSKSEFYNWYRPSTYFGRFKSITNPTVGNHEYLIGLTPEGYYDYWGQVPDVYSFDAGGWHFVTFNTNCQDAGGCKGPPSPSPQYAALEADLKAHPKACTLAFYHEPLYNIGPESTSPPNIADIWKLLASYGVDIALTGHDHNYQRWVPLDGNGSPSPTGITEWVLGAGGHGIKAFRFAVSSEPRVAAGNDQNPTAFGALKLALTSYKVDYEYINTANTVLDRGTILCGNVPVFAPLYLPMLRK